MEKKRLVKQPFADIGPVHLPEKLINMAFSRASKVEVALPRGTPPLIKARRREEARVRTAGQVLVGKLMGTVNEVPRLDDVHPFYHELADVLVGIGDLKKSLGALNWAANMIQGLADRHVKKVRWARKPADAAGARRQAYGRMASIIEQIAGNLSFLKDASHRLRKIPSIDTNSTTIVTAGCANVGKSSFVKQVSTAKPEIASYPFTTKNLSLGHIEYAGHRIQVIDTPGLLDRPLSKRNKIELQAIVALRHLARAIVFMIDPSETCGSPLEYQVSVYNEVKNTFRQTSVILALNKVDMSPPERLERARKIIGRDVKAFDMSALTGKGVEEVLRAALKAAGSQQSR